MPAPVQPQPEPQPVPTQPQPEPVRQQQPDEITTKKITVNVTFYIAMCSEGCIGITATGIDVRSSIYSNGMRVIAVDPNVIPLGSVVYVELSNGTAFKAIAGDTGGAIKGHKIDVLVSSEYEARQLGKQTATITFL